MAQRAIREYDAKRLLAAHWSRYLPEVAPYPGRVAQVGPATDLGGLPGAEPWLLTTRLAVKPDVIAGKRGKHGLVLLDVTWPEAAVWLTERRGTRAVIGGIAGELSHFIVEPFVATQDQYYLALRTEDDADVLLFSSAGGIDIESNWSQVSTWRIPVWPRPDFDEEPGWVASFRSHLRAGLPPVQADLLAQFAAGLYRLFADLNFAFLEINPLAVTGGQVIPLDLKARLDDTAQHESGVLWGPLDWPAPFGRQSSPAERRVEELDRRTGASLKLAVLNPSGAVWTMVAGGGASVIYTDTIADLGFAGELANYGEYSGNPSTAETYEYARELLGLLTATPALPGRSKYLIIGGGIANFTDVAETFAGIISALTDFAGPLRRTPVRIYVRRGGPNYEEGLRQIELACKAIGVPVSVFGPELHMTRIVAMALADATKETDR